MTPLTAPLTAPLMTLPHNEKPAHIALLLPLKSAIFGSSAAAVQQGFMAAAVLEPQSLPVRIYDSMDENSNVAAVYQNALSEGARAVVGPLTRNGVTSLTKLHNFPVPTLNLNIVESGIEQNLYFFGMAIEAEARQIATLAKNQGMKQAIVIYGNDNLAHRLQFAFEDQWTAEGGIISREIEYSGDTNVFSGISSDPDSMVFFATEAGQSRMIRPFLPRNLAVYGTSQLFNGNKDTLQNFDLEGVHFVEMPWLMQPDITLSYPHDPLSIDKERLFALGIDAYHLINLLLDNKIDSGLPFNGATGNISLNDAIFERKALPSIFTQGHAQSADAPAIATTPLFPYRSTSPVDAGTPFGAAAAPATANGHDNNHF